LQQKNNVKSKKKTLKNNVSPFFKKQKKKHKFKQKKIKKKILKLKKYIRKLFKETK
jgi:hypothetical protein